MTIEERNALVERYIPLVCKIAMGIMARNVPSCVEARDVIQDTLVAVIPEIEGFVSKNGATMTTYLHWVIRRRVIDSIRKQMPKDRYGLYFTPHSTSPTWIHGIDRSILKEHLTPKQLQAVELVYIYGFTQRRAAEKLGISERALCYRLYPAIEKLKRSLI